MMSIAIYDMDRTITRTGTYTAFLVHMALHIAPWRLILTPLTGLVMLAYVLGLISRSRVKELNQRLMMGGKVSRARILPAVEAYADHVIARNIRTEALAQIARDRAEGRRLIIASASYRLYVEPIARRLGFDDVIATDHLGQQTEWLHAKIAGENCYDKAKLAMIEAHLAAGGITRADAHIRAYSDHISDVPMLEYADEAVAANPHAPLRGLAQHRGWQIVDWA